jgi:hypothetical protein
MFIPLVPRIVSSVCRPPLHYCLCRSLACAGCAPFHSSSFCATNCCLFKKVGSAPHIPLATFNRNVRCLCRHCPQPITHSLVILLPHVMLPTSRYLLAPRSPLYFSAELREFLATGDGNPHTKKPAEQRQSELRDAFLPMLAQVS